MLLTKTLRTAAAVAALSFVTVTTVAAQAKDYRLDGMFGWLGIGQITELEKGHFFWTGQFSGVYVDKDPASPLATTSWACPGFNDVGTAAGGYCIITDNAGDELFAKWANDGKVPVSTGTFSYTGGTGKFAGATGKGDFKGIFVGPAHPDGTQSGYTTFSNAVLTLSK